MRAALRRGWRRRRVRGRRRGLAAQLAERELEHAQRVRNVAAFLELQAQGLSRAAAAERLGLAEGTIVDWARRHGQGTLLPRPLGRRAHQASTHSRNVVCSLLDLLGPNVGVPTLRELADPLLPADDRLNRRELEELLARYREVYRVQQVALLHALSWATPGAVWAMDFTAPPVPVEGGATAILVVRDLASGFTLEALPVLAADAATVTAVLQRLCHEHGAPLVIKSDNGSHFTATAVQGVLARYGVTWLPSPPYCPTYNGAIEAGIGGLKGRAADVAGGRAYWTRADVEAARLLGNEQPARRQGGAPAHAWAARTPISAGIRVGFLAAVRRGAKDAALARGELDLAWLGAGEQAKLQRAIVARALVEYGFLSIRRRWVSPPVRCSKATNIR